MVRLNKLGRLVIRLQDNRRLFSDNEKQILFDEVYGRCPICGKCLTHNKNGRIYRTFEVAHIYPANPTPDEEALIVTPATLPLSELIKLASLFLVSSSAFTC